MSYTYRRFAYNCEKVSALDFIKFLSLLGYSTTLEDLSETGGGLRFRIAGKPMWIHLPFVDDLVKTDFSPMYKYILVVWENHAPYYFTPESVKRDTYDEKLEEVYKEDEKLFLKLKRKFQMKKDEQPWAIKDLKWIKSL